MKNSREDTVVATKVFGHMKNLSNGNGLCRKQAIEFHLNSLRPISSDYDELHKLHVWNHDPTIGQLLSTYTGVVHQGKDRYTFDSMMWTYQLVTAKPEHAEKVMEVLEAISREYDTDYLKEPHWLKAIW